MASLNGRAITLNPYSVTEQKLVIGVAEFFYKFRSKFSAV